MEKARKAAQREATQGLGGRLLDRGSQYLDPNAYKANKQKESDDIFDSGFGLLVKNTIYGLAIAGVLFDVFINSVRVLRARPPPARRPSATNLPPTHPPATSPFPPPPATFKPSTPSVTRCYWVLHPSFLG